MKKEFEKEYRLKKKKKNISVLVWIYRYIHLCFTESLCCTHETNNIVNQLYFNLKNKEKFQKKTNPLPSWCLQPRDKTQTIKMVNR